MGFKENLRAELDYKGMLVKELAKKSGIKKQTIDNYLSAHNSMPSAETAVKLARALETSVEFLVSGKAPSSPKKAKKEQEILLENYQRLSPQKRKIIFDLIQAL